MPAHDTASAPSDLLLFDDHTSDSCDYDTRRSNRTDTRLTVRYTPRWALLHRTQSNPDNLVTRRYTASSRTVPVGVKSGERNRNAGPRRIVEDVEVRV